MAIDKSQKARAGLISAREIIKKYAITYQTLNHYTNLGLIEVVAKKGNIRLYNDTQIRESLAEISQLIKEGYPLRLIRKKLRG